MGCPFCADITAVIPDKENKIHLHCLGDFCISKSLYDNEIECIIKETAEKNKMSIETIRCFLKYKIANDIEFSKKTEFNKQDIEEILSNITPLNNLQRINQLILFIGKRTEHPGVALYKSFKNPGTTDSLTQVASIGNFVNYEAMCKIMGDGDFRHFFNVVPRNHLDITLTNKGWERFQELEKIKDGRSAFVAMSFGHTEEEIKKRKDFFEQAIKKPLEDVKWKAERVDTKTRTGLIDDFIIHDIQHASLVIADISDSNLGVYWEAGYAEALGKSVVYIRDISFPQPHFDVQHRMRIDFSNIKELGENLKKLINDNFKK